MYTRIFSKARISWPRYLRIETIYWMFFKSASQIFFCRFDGESTPSPRRSFRSTYREEGRQLTLHHEASRHRWQMEPAVKWEYPSLGCANRNVCATYQAARHSRQDDVIRVRRTHGKGMGLVSGIIEVDHKSVTLVNGDHICREVVISLEPCGECGVE